MSRELWRCRCGVPLGSSEDPPLQLPSPAADVIIRSLREMIGGEPTELPLLEQREPPRICRVCGTVYMLPRQTFPRSEAQH
jgi:hypothetical protein